MAKIRIRDKKLSPDALPKKMMASRKKIKLYKILLRLSVTLNVLAGFYLYFNNCL